MKCWRQFAGQIKQFDTPQHLSLMLTVVGRHDNGAIASKSSKAPLA